MTEKAPTSTKEQGPEINIRLAQAEDIKAYTDLLQRTYEDTYTNEKKGLPKELFSKEVFNTEYNQEYLRDNLRIVDDQKTWLAFDGEKLVGSVTATSKGEDCEFRGFYVDPAYQGHGIGKKLVDLANTFAGNRDVVLDTYTHNEKTLAMYRKLGFEDDGPNPIFHRHWSEWPEGVEAESIRLRLKRKKG